MTTAALPAVRRVRAAEYRVCRQHAGAAVGERIGGRGSFREQVIEEIGHVGDIRRIIAVRVRGGNAACLGMVFKLAQIAQSGWRRLNGAGLIVKLLEGHRFVDGLAQKMEEKDAA